MKGNIFNEPGVMYCESIISADGQLHEGPVVFVETDEIKAELDAWDAKVKEITDQSRANWLM